MKPILIPTDQFLQATRVWRTGPPPHVGWWNASDVRLCDAWRWWNGAYWSEVVFADLWEGSDLDRVTAVAEIQNVGPQSSIEWSDYWPENARVPRLDPTGGHWTFNITGKLPAGLRRRIDVAYMDGTVEKHVVAAHLYWGKGPCDTCVAAWRLAA